MTTKPTNQGEKAGFCVELAQRMRDLRKSLGLSQLELANEMGHNNHGIVSHIEKGNSLPKVDALARLSELHDIDLHELITGKPSPAAQQLELDRVKLLSTHAKHMGLLLGGLVEMRQDRADELVEAKAKLAKGTDDDDDLKEFIGELESEIHGLDAQLKILLDDVPWVKESLAQILDRPNGLTP
ncbi:MAG: helix-turn-helix domain-containing protein [Sedimentisphaerales bacterium]|nr:helix-turn-helix domain-containing protein [Sedimentisphaerales bacterium]